MRKTILLRLAAPLQSWGSKSKFNVRETEKEPTKSGIIGLLASALGRSKEDSIDDLVKLRFGVRVEQEGHILRDYHTAVKKGTTKDKDLMYVTNRYYLSDAVFLVALEGASDLIEQLEEALKRPQRPLYLGRKSCPPTGKLCLGVVDLSLEEALRSIEWQASDWYKEKQLRKLGKKLAEEKVLLVMDSDGAYGELIRDVPISFSWECRKFTYRYKRMEQVRLGNIYKECMAGGTQTEHDAFDLLGGEEECICHESN